jgi:anti-sigma regulatory factor (Ser/Thr protein kinase)
MNASFKFVLPSQARFLPVVRAAVGELGAACGLTEEECRGVALAVDEAMANVIRHAYRGRPDGSIEIDCCTRDGRLEVTLLDQGEPPDPERLRPHPLDDFSLGGRGTYIMRTIMDEVCYETVSGGNQLRLSRRLPATGNGAEAEGKKL